MNENNALLHPAPWFSSALVCPLQSSKVIKFSHRCTSAIFMHPFARCHRLTIHRQVLSHTLSRGARMRMSLNFSCHLPQTPPTPLPATILVCPGKTAQMASRSRHSLLEPERERPPPRSKMKPIVVKLAYPTRHQPKLQPNHSLLPHPSRGLTVCASRVS